MHCVTAIDANIVLRILVCHGVLLNVIRLSLLIHSAYIDCNTQTVVESFSVNIQYFSLT